MELLFISPRMMIAATLFLVHKFLRVAGDTPLDVMACQVTKRKGEAAPVGLEIFDYEIARDETGDFVIVKGLRTSREWLTELARNHLCGIRFTLPAKIGGMLRQAL